MARIVIGLLGICVFGLLAGPAQAGPAIVFDVRTGTVFYSESPDQPWHPASLTKLMTAYLTFDALKAGRIKPDDKVVASPTSRRQPASKIGFRPGAKMTISKALEALIVKSANDVAVMVAEKIGGSVPGFVALMNETAGRLGMTRTRFVNPNGLPHKAQVTTARDMGILAKRIIEEFPEHAALFTKKYMKLGKIRMRSHNGLLKTLEGADGMKTGFICSAGFNIVASATRHGRRIIAVVLGEPTARARNARARQLLEYAFSNYLWKTLFSQASLTNLAFDPAKPTRARDVRRTVRVWACGYRPKRVKRQKAKAARKKGRAKAGNAVLAGTAIGTRFRMPGADN